MTAEAINGVALTENYGISHPLSETMHDLQDGASIVSILLKPLLVDGVGTAALRRAEEPLGGLSATSLDLFSPDSRCRPQDLEAQVAKYTCPVRTLYLFF